MRILITAGPTREYFDSVRFISNPSSGKMGYAIAAEAARRGHHVLLISGPVELLAPAGVELKLVTSADDMYEVAARAFPECQAAVMTAAVCDYKPAERLERKLQKQGQVRTVELLPTRDICAELGRTKSKRVVVGFAMEDHDHHEHAARKLRRKNCDAVVLNGIGNVGGDQAEIQVFRADAGWLPVRQGTKAELAAVVLDLVEDLTSRPAP